MTVTIKLFKPEQSQLVSYKPTIGSVSLLTIERRQGNGNIYHLRSIEAIKPSCGESGLALQQISSSTTVNLMRKVFGSRSEGPVLDTVLYLPDEANYSWRSSLDHQGYKPGLHYKIEQLGNRAEIPLGVTLPSWQPVMN